MGQGATRWGSRGALPTRKGASVARERPTASHIDNHDLADQPMRAAPGLGTRPDTGSEEVAEIVLRAGRLGLSRWRVATALGVSPDELARIEQLNE